MWCRVLPLKLTGVFSSIHQRATPKAERPTKAPPVGTPSESFVASADRSAMILVAREERGGRTCMPLLLLTAAVLLPAPFASASFASAARAMPAIHEQQLLQRARPLVLLGDTAEETQRGGAGGNLISSGWAAAQRARKEREAEKYRQLAEREAASKAAAADGLAAARKNEQDKRREREAAVASYIDNVDLYRPGGVLRQETSKLTHKGIADSMKNSSPVIAAEDALARAARTCNTLPPAEAVGMLSAVMAEAEKAGVRATAPSLVKARRLLSTLEDAATQVSKGDARDESALDPEEAKKQAALDALFGGGYAAPAEEL